MALGRFDVISRDCVPPTPAGPIPLALAAWPR